MVLPLTGRILEVVRVEVFRGGPLGGRDVLLLLDHHIQLLCRKSNRWVSNSILQKLILTTLIFVTAIAPSIGFINRIVRIYILF